MQISGCFAARGTVETLKTFSALLPEGQQAHNGATQGFQAAFCLRRTFPVHCFPVTFRLRQYMCTRLGTVAITVCNVFEVPCEENRTSFGHHPGSWVRDWILSGPAAEERQGDDQEGRDDKTDKYMKEGARTGEGAGRVGEHLFFFSPFPFPYVGWCVLPPQTALNGRPGERCDRWEVGGVGKRSYGEQEPQTVLNGRPGRRQLGGWMWIRLG